MARPSAARARRRSALDHAAGAARVGFVADNCARGDLLGLDDGRFFVGLFGHREDLQFGVRAILP